MEVAGGGGVFVSYRREESSHFAGRLADRLIDRFGAEQVFIDVDTIEPGVDFAEAIAGAVGACAVLVAVIGPGWLAAADELGGRRLDDPDNLVRLEIGAALAHGVRVIPVLVEGAVMPRRGDLPDSLAGLARRHALRVRHESFRDDVGQLIAAIDRVLAMASAASADGAESLGFFEDSIAGAAKSPGASRNDLTRAVRLLGEAERTANFITDESSKASALSGVARALAVSDPDRAERIANSITEDWQKAWALTNIAKAIPA